MTRVGDIPPTCRHGGAAGSGDCDSLGVDLNSQCSALQQLLHCRSESVISEALRVQPIPVKGLGIVRSEYGLSLRLTGSGFSREQCLHLIGYINSFKDSLPQPSLAERLEVIFRHHMQSCMSSALPLPAKYRKLKILASLRLWFLQWQAIPAARLRQQLAGLSCILHEPEKNIRSLWGEHLVWFHFNYARRLIHLENRSHSAGYLQAFFWPDKSAYQQVIHGNSASRVLLSIHMGDFFGGFRALASLAESGRRAISLRREKTGDHGMQYFNADHIVHQVFYHGQQQPGAIVAALRRGQHTLATLFDLKDDFGSTVVVNFFGQRARFVKGPAQLAILGRCQIFPFVCFEQQGQHCIEMAPAIDTRLRADESLHQGTVRITQTLVKLAEGWIRRWPAQWKYLPVLPAYFEAAH